MGLIDGSNNLPTRFRYKPFGELDAGSYENVTSHLSYAAREHDWHSRLIFMRNRYYDAHLGRFISEDPIGLAGGINLYACTGNDPVNHRDPFGLCVEVVGASKADHKAVSEGQK